MLIPPTHRPRIHCSIDALFHVGALPITRAVGLVRAKKAGLKPASVNVQFNVKTAPADGEQAADPGAAQ